MLSLNLKEESVCHVNEQRKAGFSWALAASRPEAECIRCLLLMKLFAVPWNRHAISPSPDLCRSTGWGSQARCCTLVWVPRDGSIFPPCPQKWQLRGQDRAEPQKVRVGDNWEPPQDAESEGRTHKEWLAMDPEKFPAHEGTERMDMVAERARCQTNS